MLTGEGSPCLHPRGKEVIFCWLIY